MKFEHVVSMFKSNYDIYGFANQFFEEMKTEPNPKETIENLMTENDKLKNGITFILSIYYYYFDEIQQGSTFSKIMKRLDSLNKFFFIECYFHRKNY